MSDLYISTINHLVTEMVEEKKSTKKTSKNIDAFLPSAVKNQAIKDAKSVFKKVRKSKYEVIPVLKKPVCIWNNQNYSFDYTHIFLFVNSKCPKCKSIINELDTIENHYDLKIIVINNDESFDDSLIKTKLGPSIQYVRSNHIAMSYFVHASPTAAIVERGKIKAYGKVPNFNTLNNFLITEKQKEIS